MQMLYPYMTWLLIATGFTGGLTLVFVVRWVNNWLFPALELAVHHAPSSCTEAVVGLLGRARSEVLMQAGAFTSKPIAQALVDAKTRGVHIEILLNRAGEAEMQAELGELLGEGIKPLIDAEHPSSPLQLLIVDGQTVATGSFKFIQQTERENAESLLIVKHHPDTARAYRKQFEDHKAHSQPAAKPQAALPIQRKAA